jgi:multidrug resistance efflux pump
MMGEEAYARARKSGLKEYHNRMQKRVSPYLPVLEEIETRLNTTTTTQAVINAQQTGIIATLQGQVMQLNNMTGLYIKQPVMAASEAALTALKPAAATPAPTGN